MITKENFHKLDHIETQTVEDDLAVTREEIDMRQRALTPLHEDRVNNKVRIYTLEGEIASRTEFIKDLQNLLEFRKNDS